MVPDSSPATAASLPAPADTPRSSGAFSRYPKDCRGGMLLPGLHHRRHWIFDLDGTLTVAVHDFDAIRRALALPPGKPILESIAELAPEVAAPIRRRLDALELELADRARPQAGALELLEALAERKCVLGILTRNSEINALRTLAACGLDHFFSEGHVVGRESCAPKPSPEGVRRLLDAWGAACHDAVMVGDYLFDLLAGRAAGVATVHFDPEERGEWTEHADLRTTSLTELRQRLRAERP